MAERITIQERYAALIAAAGDREMIGAVLTSLGEPKMVTVAGCYAVGYRVCWVPGRSRDNIGVSVGDIAGGLQELFPCGQPCRCSRWEVAQVLRGQVKK